MDRNLYWLWDYLDNGTVQIGLYFAIYIWCVFLIRVWFSKGHQDESLEYETTASVVLPVYKEDIHVFESCVKTLRAADSAIELIIVINGVWQERAAIEHIARRSADQVIITDHPSKREAIAQGTFASRGDVTILLDSDTFVSQNATKEILKPFRDQAVGGVTSRQRIYQPNRTILARIADWLESIRFLINQKSQSNFGAVGCLPGRMIAIRRSIVVENTASFLAQTILGVRCISGDDRVLTSCCLKSGYRTLVQSTAVVRTIAPRSWREFFLQQLRWARSSQRETLISLNWLYRFPLTFFCFVADILTPIFFVVVLGASALSIIGGGNQAEFLLVFAAIFAVLSLGLRQVPHLWCSPRDIWLLPIFAATAVLLALLRLFGLLTCLNSSWQTRGPDSETQRTVTLGRIPAE